MKLVKIGSIIKNCCNKQRINVMWDGECLCDSAGRHIADGQAATLEEAQNLAPWLWSGYAWDYRPVESK